MVLMEHNGWYDGGMSSTVTSTGATTCTFPTIIEIEMAYGHCSITCSSLALGFEDGEEVIIREEIQTPFPLAKKVKLVCNYKGPQLFITSPHFRKTLRSNKVYYTHRKRNRRNL